jgi:O-antigen ligase
VNITDHWRFGIYRAPSLLGNPNLLGRYSLLFLTLYLCIKKKVNFVVVGALLTGIFLSISRLVYTGFVFMAGIQIFRGRRWLIALIAIPMIILLFSKSPLSEFDMTEGQKQRGFITYREYTQHKAIEVWKDHSFWGVGPGMFGGVVSVMFQSPVYEEYNFSRGPKNLLERWKSIDQFWPQVLAEMGIIGTVAFAGFFITLFITFFMLRQRATSEEMRGLFTGLAIFTIVIPIYSLGSPLKDAVIFTYFAFVGMGLGCLINRNDK